MKVMTSVITMKHPNWWGDVVESIGHRSPTSGQRPYGSADATLESCITASINLEVMVMWPSFLCRRYAPYMVLKSTLVITWLSADRQASWPGKLYSERFTAVNVLRRIEENVPSWATWQDSWRTVSTLMYRHSTVYASCKYLVHSPVNKVVL